MNIFNNKTAYFKYIYIDLKYIHFYNGTINKQEFHLIYSKMIYLPEPRVMNSVVCYFSIKMTSPNVQNNPLNCDVFHIIFN